MSRISRALGLGLVVCAMAGGPAAADIVNGDFEDGNTGWDVDSDTVGGAIAEVTSDGRLHLNVVHTWYYDNGWTFDGFPFLEEAVAVQNVPADGNGLHAPLGTTQLALDPNIEVTFSDNVPEGTVAGVDLSVTYRLNDGSDNEEPAPGVLGNDEGLIELPGIDVTRPVEIELRTLSMFSPMGLDTAETYTITVDAYLDNFGFVPEPAGLAVLAVGAVGLLRRRRRA